MGRGTDYPFQHFGAPYLESDYSFIPVSNFGSKNPKHKNIRCFGTDLRNNTIKLNKINLDWLITTYNLCPDKEKFFNSFFDKLAGTSKLRLQIVAGMNSKEIRESWQEDLNDFKKIRNKYLIY